MADEADSASENEQFDITVKLSSRERHTLPETGYCHNCGERISAGLFCDGDCREDYDKRARFNRMKPV